MPVDIKIVQQRTKDRIVKEYVEASDYDVIKTTSGFKERYNEIYKEEFDKEDKKQSSNLPVPVSKPVITACSGNQQPTQGKKDPNIKCNFSTVTVEKAGRKYTLQIDKNTPSGGNVLEIVAGPYVNTQDVTVTVNGLEGPCVDGHKNKVMDLVNPKPVSKSDTILKFKAASIEYVPFLDSLWPSGAAWNTYDIPISTCNGKKSAIIKVYPDIEYAFSVGFNPFPNKTHHGIGDGSLNFNKVDEKKWTFSGSVKQDLKELSLEKAIEYEKIKKTLTTVDKIVAVYKTLSDTVTKFTHPIKSTFEIEIKYINAKVDIKFKWVEIENNSKCGFQSSLDLQLKPLVGVELTVDLLGIALKSFPGIGTILYEICDKVGDGELGSVKINFNLSGEINCMLGGLKNVSDNDIKFIKTNVSGDITAGLKAKINLSTKKYTGDSWGIETGGKAGGEAKVSLGAKITENDIQKADIYYSFNGLVASYSFFIKANAGVWTLEKKKEDETTVFDKIDEQTITTINLKI